MGRSVRKIPCPESGTPCGGESDDPCLSHKHCLVYNKLTYPSLLTLLVIVLKMYSCYRGLPNQLEKRRQVASHQEVVTGRRLIVSEGVQRITFHKVCHLILHHRLMDGLGCLDGGCPASHPKCHYNNSRVEAFEGTSSHGNKE